MIKLTLAISLAAYLLSCNGGVESQSQSQPMQDLPTTTGPYVIGVTDVAFLATSTLSPRRMMIRVRYAACEKSTCDTNTSAFKPALVYQPGEAIVLARVPPGINETEVQAMTYSFQDAPVCEDCEFRGWVIFLHGATGAIADHTVLMEEIASHGYVSVALAHPGAAGTRMVPTRQALPWCVYTSSSFSFVIVVTRDDISSVRFCMEAYVNESFW